MNGIINVYKERGFTSHDVVAKLRGILKMKKIGHTGTLDPDACGVLPVCVGQATKVCDLLTDRKKTYEAVLLLGRETDTQDTSGQILAERPVTVTAEQVFRAVDSFVGDQMQIPPMYSALKVDGKKLYELAREGKIIERKARPVTFYEITVLNMDLPRVKLRVTCSKGTYIRTLCHDIGQTLGCGGCMEQLLRTCVSPFVIEESRTLGEIQALADQGQVESILCPVDHLFMDLPAMTILPDYTKYMYNGNALQAKWLVTLSDAQADQNPVADVNAARPMAAALRLYTEKNEFFGVYEYDCEKRMYKGRKLFYGG